MQYLGKIFFDDFDKGGLIMQPTGTVVAVEPGFAMVHLVRHSACSNCHACSLGSSDSASITVSAIDPIEVQIGMQVELFFPPAQGLKAALYVYALPLLTLLLSYPLLNVLNLPGGELTAALGSIILSFASFFLLRLSENRRSTDPRYLPQIVRVVSS